MLLSFYLRGTRDAAVFTSQGQTSSPPLCPATWSGKSFRDLPLGTACWEISSYKRLGDTPIYGVIHVPSQHGNRSNAAHSTQHPLMDVTRRRTQCSDQEPEFLLEGTTASVGLTDAGSLRQVFQTFRVE